MNEGNKRTIVYTDIVDSPPGNWVITIRSQVVLYVNMSVEIYLPVTAPISFSGTDTITFNPYAADDPTEHGKPVYFTIIVFYE